MQFDFAAKELTIKLVYYGPALSGKTTNLQSLHELADARSRGRLMTLETQDDRTLFFDMLPLTFRGRRGDVCDPHQGLHRPRAGRSTRSTRRLVLQGADGVAFIADSQLAETREQRRGVPRPAREPEGATASNSADAARHPVQQARPARTSAPTPSSPSSRARGKEPVYQAVRHPGSGVLETFFGLLAPHVAARSTPSTSSAKKLGIDGETLPRRRRREARVPTCQSSSSSRACVGGALEVLRPEREWHVSDDADDPRRSTLDG